MTILGVGPFELVLIVLIALVVVGPERLPDLLHTAGTYVRRARRAIEDLRHQARNELGEDYDYVEQQVRTLRELNPRRQIQELAGSLLEDPSSNRIQPPAPAPSPAPLAVASSSRLRDLARQTLEQPALDQPLGDSPPLPAALSSAEQPALDQPLGDSPPSSAESSSAGS